MKNILQVMSEYVRMHNELNPGSVKAVLARAPAEQVAGRFAAMDGFERGYYSNGLQAFPENLTLAESLQLESDLWPYLDGGCITQIYLYDEKPDPAALWGLTRNIIANTNINYFCYNITFTKCDRCHAILPGFKKSCDCGSTNLTVISRVTGYMSPLAQIIDGKVKYLWNSAKVMEYFDRPRDQI
jgi:anaerobic ribonucleoside-triphosphate reductase